MKKYTTQIIYLLLVITAFTFTACKEDKKSDTITITRANDINGNYTLTLERKEGTGSEYITSHNPSVINHEMELAISKNGENKYKVELKEFSIQLPAPMCTFVYDTRADTTGNTGGPFGLVTFKKEKQEQLNELLEHYRKLRGSSFLFERNTDGTFKFTSGGVAWEDYKNDLKMRTEDPEEELKKYINSDYLGTVLNETFNYAEGEFTQNTPIEKRGAKYQLNSGKSPEEHELFKQTKKTDQITTVRTLLEGTKGQWSQSKIVTTGFSPHRVNGINDITMTTTTVRKKKQDD